MDPFAPNPQQPNTVGPTDNPQPDAPQPQPQPIQPQQPVMPAQPTPAPNFSTETRQMPQDDATQQPVGQVFGQPGMNQPLPPKKKRNKLKALLVVLLALGVLGGGSAAAYFGVIVPNKPENVLKTAFQNTLNQKSVTATMSLDVKDTSSLAYKAAIVAKSDLNKKALGLTINTTVSGYKVGGEVRYVGTTAYVKVDDLSNIAKLISASGSEYGTLATELNSKVANKWFEIDSTILKEAKLDCALGTDLSVSKEDYKVLADGFKQNPFLTITSTSSDTVNGQAVTKYQLSLDDKKADAYGETFPKTSLYKKLNSCFSDASSSANSSQSSIDKDITNTLKEATGSTGKTPLTVWVNKKDKTISRLAIESTEEDKKQGTTGTFDATFDYRPVSIEKPSGSQPITDLVTEVMQLYQGQPVLGASIDRLIP